MQRSLAKLLNELSKNNYTATPEQVMTLANHVKSMEKQEKIAALKARLRALQA